MPYRNITLWGHNSSEEHPHALPTDWTPSTPLAILGDFEGHDPYNSAVRQSNHVMTPAHPNLDDTANIVPHLSRRS